MITTLSTLDMSHEEWLMQRRKGIGGSDAGALLGLNPYRGAYDVYADKIGMAPPVEDNEAMRQGRDLEAYVAERFEQETGKRVRRRNAIITNSEYPFALANIDREIVGEHAGLECKTTSVLSLTRYKNGEFPSEYYCQCMHYLMVTGWDKWYLAVLVYGTDFKIFEIERDEDEIAALVEAERRFWEDNVAKGVPPAPSGADGTDKTISAVYPNDNGDIDTVDITPFASEVQRYITLTDRIKTYDREKNAIKQHIQLYMKDAGRAKCDIAKVSWKSQTRSRYDTEKLIADFVPAGTDLSAYKKTTTIRPFRLEEIKNG